MNDMAHLRGDTEFAAAVLKLAEDATRHDWLNELAVRVARDVLLSASNSGVRQVQIPRNDAGGVDTKALIEAFLVEVRPLHDGHDYLDDYWNFIWEHAWPEGIADAVLGTTAYDAHAAAELRNEIERQAEDIGLTEPPPFDAQDLIAFVQDWRERFIEELASIKDSSRKPA